MKPMDTINSTLPNDSSSSDCSIGDITLVEQTRGNKEMEDTEYKRVPISDLISDLFHGKAPKVLVVLVALFNELSHSEAK